MNFSSYNLSKEIMRQIEAQGYTTPTPIQAQTIPTALKGRDVMGLAQTGTGKTAAFVLPMLERFMSGSRGTLRGLIIAPTRELAEQIHETIEILGRYTGVKSLTIYGGVSMGNQVKGLRRGVDIVVACPGRLLDHMEQRTIQLNKIEVLVLDEADHMFDMGFLPGIKQILSNLPKQRQTLLFSATMPAEIRSLANAILKDPLTVELEHTRPVDAITQASYAVAGHLKTALLLEILKQTPTQSVLIFTRTKHRAKGLDTILKKNGYNVSSLQGNLSQNRRQEALTGFRDGTYDIMVATDIAARGIDISRVSHVINYDAPDTADAYTHRIGRTGRASRTGDAYIFITPEDEYMLSLIIKRCEGNIEPRIVEGFNYNAAPTAGAEFPRAPHQPRGRSGGGGGGDRRYGSSSRSSDGDRPKKIRQKKRY